MSQFFIGENEMEDRIPFLNIIDPIIFDDKRLKFTMVLTASSGVFLLLLAVGSYVLLSDNKKGE